jgi:hypothetical protein
MIPIILAPPVTGREAPSISTGCGYISRRWCTTCRAGGRRLVQRVDRYRATLVAGTPVFENGEETGARPGRQVRSGR